MSKILCVASVGTSDTQAFPHTASAESKMDTCKDTVILANAGIHSFSEVYVARSLDSHFRGNDRDAKFAFLSVGRH